MSDADKFLSVFRWAIEHTSNSGDPRAGRSALDGVEIRDLPGPAGGSDARDPPKPMSDADKEFLENAIKSITVSSVLGQISAFSGHCLSVRPCSTCFVMFPSNLSSYADR